MRSMTLPGALLVASILALPAYAAGQYWSLDEHNTQDSMTWHNSEHHSLVLDSTAGKGVAVVKIVPAGTHGLQPGDVILAVNGKPVLHVADLIQQANDDEHGTVTLQLQRGQGSEQLAMSGSDLHALVHPHP